MALNFPNSPSVGDIYEDSTSGFSYQWDGTFWKSYKFGDTILTTVSADTSPQLGGNLDINSNDITGTGDIDITGNLKISGIATASSFVGSLTGTASNATQLNSQAASYYLDYDNFSNTPTIPTNNNQLTNGAGFITTSFTNTNQLTNDAGFITASDDITGTSGGLTGSPNITVTDISASGDVSIGGTLTYEDVTNVDSVGLITARSGIHVTGVGSSVGIGTLSPTNQLHIYDGTSANDRAELKIESFRPIIRFQDRSSPSASAEIVGDNGLKFNVSTPVDDDTALTERMRIDSSGRLLVGTDTALQTANSITPALQVSGTSSAASASLTRFSGASSAGSTLNFNKSRSSTQGTFSAVSSGDDLGIIIFNGDDGTNFKSGAWIRSQVDNTPGTNDMPGRLIFATTADAASSPTERMRIDSSGNIGVNLASPTQKIDVDGNILARTSDNSKGAYLSNDGALEIYRSNSNGYIDFKTSNSEDYDCRIQQDNNGLKFEVGGSGSTTIGMRITSDGNLDFDGSKLNGTLTSTISDDSYATITPPIKGGHMIITSFSTYDTYPQPTGSGMIYFDVGASRLLVVIFDTENVRQGSGTYLTTAISSSTAATDFTDGITTITAPTADTRTLRIFNRTGGNRKYKIVFF